MPGTYATQPVWPGFTAELEFSANAKNLNGIDCEDRRLGAHLNTSRDLECRRSEVRTKLREHSVPHTRAPAECKVQIGAGTVPTLVRYLQRQNANQQDSSSDSLKVSLLDSKCKMAEDCLRSHLQCSIGRGLENHHIRIRKLALVRVMLESTLEFVNKLLRIRMFEPKPALDNLRKVCAKGCRVEWGDIDSLARYCRPDDRISKVVDEGYEWIGVLVVDAKAKSPGPPDSMAGKRRGETVAGLEIDSENAAHDEAKRSDAGTQRHHSESSCIMGATRIDAFPSRVPESMPDFP
ncbi:hypothetical protein B0H19DRAFT_1076310 [Mycena capillaripes]|nr:hypothetical protein B0H19DRAFT_1076310 [Mycena capillaripes]